MESAGVHQVVDIEWKFGGKNLIVVSRTYNFIAFAWCIVDGR